MILGLWAVHILLSFWCIFNGRSVFLVEFFFLSLPPVSVSDTYRKYPGKMSRSFSSTNEKLINFNHILLLFSHLVKYDPLRPHGLQHTRLSCPSLSPEFALKLMSIESVLPSNHLILCYSLLLLPSIFPSIRVSSNESGQWGHFVPSSPN